MTESRPFLSVVVAAYNGAPYIEEQLDSIAAQTLPFDELIIRDDGSTDQTPEVIQAWINRHPDLNIRLIKDGANLGYIRNFHALLSQAKGDYIFLSDQDDRWHPDKIEKMMEQIKIQPGIQLLASSFSFMHGNGEVYSVEPIPGWSNQNLLHVDNLKEGSLNQISLQTIAHHNGFQGCAMMVSKELAKRYVEDENFILPHDWQLALLAAIQNGLYYLDLSLFDYRIHDANTTSLPQATPDNLKIKLQRTLSHYYRTAPFSDRRNFLESLSITSPADWNDDLARQKAFYEAYLDTVEKRKLSSYIALMRDPSNGLLTAKDKISLLLYVLFSDGSGDER